MVQGWTMNVSSDKPDPGLIYDLYTGGFKPQIIRIALLLDIFSPLDSNSMNANEVAQVCHGDPLGMRYLLDYLTSVNLLRRQNGQYTLTRTAAAFLVPQQKSYVGNLLLAFTGTAIWDSVMQALRRGQPVPFEEFHAQDAWLESYSSWRITNSLEMWQAAGIKAEAGSSLRVLDLACGCAIKSLSLAQLAPTVYVTCLDNAAVLVVVRDLAERMQVLSQVTLWPENLLTADLGEARFEVCLLGQITHYLTERQNRDVFRRIYAALLPNGTLVIDVPMSTEQPSEWASFLSLILWANGGGAAYSFDTYRLWLEEAGFCQVRQSSERWLSATK